MLLDNPILLPSSQLPPTAQPGQLCFIQDIGLYQFISDSWQLVTSKLTDGETYDINISGLATESTKLAAARTINGVAFNGTTNIDIYMPKRPTYVTDPKWNVVEGGTVDVTAALTAIINSGADKIVWPAGTYLVSSLPIVSGQEWIGAGIGKTKIVWNKANGSHQNMVQSTTGLDSVFIHDISFIGNRPYQTTPSTTGQDMACCHFRAGSNTNITFQDVSFEDFGDNSGVGGAGVFIGATSGTTNIIKNISFSRCTFKNISNVPGLYINGDSHFHQSTSNITVENCNFICDINNADQNAVYVLGGDAFPATNVRITSNNFNISTSIDCAIELNYVDGFSIYENAITLTGSGSITGTLLRDTVMNGTIAANRYLNYGTGVGANSGISLVNLTSGYAQSGIAINDNTFYNWCVPGSQTSAVSISRGSSKVHISNNYFSGVDASNIFTSCISLAQCSDILVHDNHFSYVRYPLSFGDNVSNVSFKDNVMTHCGDGVVSIISEFVPGQSNTGLRFRDNLVVSPISGTPNFIAIQPLTSVGNSVSNNDIPATMKLLGDSSVPKFQSIVNLAKMGTTLAGTSYSFSQGSLPMAANTGFIIGANLDASSPACAVGDIVVVSVNVDLQGCMIHAYVSSAGTIRVRVQNVTTDTITVAAATWTVVVIKP